MSSESHPLRSGQQYPIYNQPTDPPSVPHPPAPNELGQPRLNGIPQSSPPTYYMASAIMPVLAPMGKTSQNITCWFCHRAVQTRIEHRPGAFTWCSCSLLCCCGCCFGCCLLPFFCKPCQDVYHFCSYCSSPLGIYTRL